MVEDSYGGFWRRAVAFSIDKIILFFTSLFILFIGVLSLAISFLSHYRDMLPERFEEITITFVAVYLFTTIFISMFYFTYFHGAAGQTPGKMILGLKVVQTTGEQMTFGLAFLRWVGYIISAVIFYLGFIWIAFDAKKQGWHDKIAGTIVIRVRNIVDGPARAPDEKGLDKEGDFL
jgi:uncharacterized RDD family membrane protein YckC